MMKWKDLKSWQKRKIIRWFSFFIVIAILYIGYVVMDMQKEKQASKDAWAAMMAQDKAIQEQTYDEDNPPTFVTVGTYLETIKDISLKTNSYRISFVAWFRWKDNDNLDFTKHGRVYNAQQHSLEVLKDYHKDGVHYQQILVDVTCSRNFSTKRFPLDTHNMSFYLESTESSEDVIFIADTLNSGVNPNLSVSGYAVTGYFVSSTFYDFPNTLNNPRLNNPMQHAMMATHLQTARGDLGLYLRCFIALLGALIWVMISVYICAHHRVNPLGTLSSALFGSIGNVMIGAALLPDVLELGLVEFVNFFGTLVIIGGTLCIIQINNIRDNRKGFGDGENTANDARLYAKFFGRVMFFTLLAIAIIGNLIIPLSTYNWS